MTAAGNGYAPDVAQTVHAGTGLFPSAAANPLIIQHNNRHLFCKKEPLWRADQESSIAGRR